MRLSLFMPSATVRTPGYGGEWMIGKFAPALTLLLLTISLGSRGFAQTTPAGQTPVPSPAAQQPAAQAPAVPQPDTSQEPASDEPLGRKPKPRDYKNSSFNVGA